MYVLRLFAFFAVCAWTYDFLNWGIHAAANALN